MTKKVVVAFIMLCVLGLSYAFGEGVTVYAPNKASSTSGVSVLRAVDGDTLVVSKAGVETRVRLIGVDTPETVKPGSAKECYGQEASDFTKKFVEGKSLVLESDVSKTDRYGRELAYVYVEGKMLNSELIKGGYGKSLAVKPDVRYADQFAKLETEARTSKAGLWKVCP